MHSSFVWPSLDPSGDYPGSWAAPVPSGDARRPLVSPGLPGAILEHRISSSPEPVTPITADGLGVPCDPRRLGGWLEKSQDLSWIWWIVTSWVPRHAPSLPGINLLSLLPHEYPNRGPQLYLGITQRI